VPRLWAHRAPPPRRAVHPRTGVPRAPARRVVRARTPGEGGGVAAPQAHQSPGNARAAGRRPHGSGARGPPDGDARPAVGPAARAPVSLATCVTRPLIRHLMSTRQPHERQRSPHGRQITPWSPLRGRRRRREARPRFFTNIVFDRHSAGRPRHSSCRWEARRPIWGFFGTAVPST
jgi:hypothetical protein